MLHTSDMPVEAARWAASKKQAEQLAALAALVELEVAFESEDGSVEIKENYGE